jgi:CRP-like cAMP-binding protein
MSPAMNRFYMAMLQEALIISQQKSDASRFESARQRYIRLLNEHPEIVKRASMNQIASYLVMTPETLSRIRSAL